MATKRIGRPPLDPEGPSVKVGARVSARQFDQLYRVAREQRTTIAEVVRRVLTTTLRDRRGEGEK
jgi:hypothetical protein